MNHNLPNPEKKIGSQKRRLDYPLSKKEQEFLDRQQQRQENDKKFLRELEPQSKIQNKTPEQIGHEKELEQQYHKSHEEYMAQIAEQLSTLTKQNGEDFEAYKTKVREDLRSGSEPSHEGKSGFQSYGAITQSDSSGKRDFDLFGTDAQNSDASKRRSNDRKIDDGLDSLYEQPPYKDDFDVGYGQQSKSQGLEALNPQRNGQEMRRLRGQERTNVTNVLRRTVEIFRTSTEGINLEELPTQAKKLVKELIKYGKNDLDGKEVPIDRYSTAVKELEGILKTIENMQRVTKQEIFREINEKLEKADKERSKREDDKGQGVDEQQPGNVGNGTFANKAEVRQQRSGSVIDMLRDKLEAPDRKENRTT